MIRFLSRNAWLVPLVFALAVAAAGFTTLRALERRGRELLRSQVETTVASARESLDIWAAENERQAAFWASQPAVRELTTTLVRISRSSDNPSAALLRSTELAVLRSLLDPVVTHYGLMGWGIQGPRGAMIATQEGLDHYLGFVPTQISGPQQRTMGGAIETTAPMILDGPRGPYATMIAGAPIRNSKDEIVATFGFTINPAEEFARLLEVARHGSSGETYAFDENGVMVSPSRFDAQLREIGLLPQDPNISSALTIQIRDPGGDLTRGFEATSQLGARGLTHAAASAIMGESGTNLDGYRDYRGVLVIGAWTWLPKLRVGIASEIDSTEAYAGLASVRNHFGVLLGLLLVAALAMFGYTVLNARLRGRVEEHSELGRYTLERKLGQGGMGSVYLAKHALLRRPTAIKVLDSDNAGEEGIARFEREVQVSSSLTHPNTIQIFDFGTTPDGTFYYAMEHVRGLTLAGLVESEGPLPEARVLHVLMQAAGSLAEAHDRDLVHRDIKPANLMLCERGGLFDFVKVLDFGLVRMLGLSEDLSITKTHNLTGTPLYLAPESIDNPKAVDARSDVYQLGAVGYFMLTGRPPFEGETVVEVLGKHMRELPQPLSEAAPSKVSPELEAVIFRCLAKASEDRFADAGELLTQLEAGPAAQTWTQAEARTWWASWREAHPDVSADEDPTLSSDPKSFSVDLVRRLGRSQD